MHWYGSYYSYHYSNLYIYRSWCERLLKSGTKIILWYSNEWLLKDFTLLLKCLNQTARPFFLCWDQQVAHLSLEELGDTDGILSSLTECEEGTRASCWLVSRRGNGRTLQHLSACNYNHWSHQGPTHTHSYTVPLCSERSSSLSW